MVLQEQQVLQTTKTTFSNGLSLWKLVGGVFGGTVAGFSLAVVLAFILKRSRKSAAASCLQDDGGEEIRSGGGLCCKPTFSATIHGV